MFTRNIEGEKSWADINRNIGVFKPLIEEILKRESLPCGAISNTMHCTNAVFKVNDLIVKIFAPDESRHENERCCKSEIFGQARALSLGLLVPRIFTSGIIKDKYDFWYIVNELINGERLQERFYDMDSDEKHALGRELREIANVMNTPCEPFNHIDYSEGLIDDGYNSWLEELGFQEQFLDERKMHIKSIGINKSDLVFCHGDFTPYNILFNPDRRLHKLSVDLEKSI